MKEPHIHRLLTNDEADRPDCTRGTQQSSLSGLPTKCCISDVCEKSAQPGTIAM